MARAIDPTFSGVCGSMRTILVRVRRCGAVSLEEDTLESIMGA
jgi:hypothetical protein